MYYYEYLIYIAYFIQIFILEISNYYYIIQI